jgi:hypothetical protein
LLALFPCFQEKEKEKGGLTLGVVPIPASEKILLSFSVTKRCPPQKNIFWLLRGLPLSFSFDNMSEGLSYFKEILVLEKKTRSLTVKPCIFYEKSFS